jgi:hypothetical protein
MVGSAAVRRGFVWLVLSACAGYAGCFDTAALMSGNGSSDAGSHGGGDAGQSGGGTTPFCQSLSPSATFCDDFDEEDGGTFLKWDKVGVDPQGSVSLDGNLFFSSADSMVAQTGALASGVSSEADLLKEFQQYAQEPISITMTFEMNVQAWDTSTSGQIIAAEVIFVNSPTQYNQIVLNLNSIGAGGVSGQIAENAELEDGGTPYNNYPLQSHPGTKTWTPVEIDLSVHDFSGSMSNVVTVKLGQQTVLDTQALGIPLQGGVPWIHLGIGYVGASTTPWIVNYDNFAVTIGPI